MENRMICIRNEKYTWDHLDWKNAGVHHVRVNICGAFYIKMASVFNPSV